MMNNMDGHRMGGGGVNLERDPLDFPTTPSTPLKRIYPKP